MLELPRRPRDTAITTASKLDHSVRFSITAEETECFAQLSGDFNPLHLNRLLARRLTYGGTVAHGVHSLLRSLDLFCLSQSRQRRFARLRAWFVGPVEHEEQVDCQVSFDDDCLLKIEASCGPAKVLVVEAELTDWDGVDHMPLAESSPPVDCRELSFDEAARSSGGVDLQFDRAKFTQLFPRVSRLFPASQISTIAATTQVVGMQCPGLNSIFTKLRLAFRAEPAVGDTLRFATARAFSQLSLLKIGVESSQADGELEAFFRRSPVEQPSFCNISRSVKRDEFQNQTALVVGGSRGLGEVAAKIIAAGGGRSMITYCSGRGDALRVRDDIRSHGGDCEALQWDVLSPPVTTSALASCPTHLYYFATPQIKLTKSFAWDDRRFRTFCDYYVDGLQRTVAAIRQFWLTQQSPLQVFYPSTVLLETQGPVAAEYAAAKAAGESLCRFLEYEQPGTCCHCVRLPQILTDQTNSLVASASADPTSTLLEMIRPISKPDVPGVKAA